jgi:glycerol-3-phosphate acyltransferase PlsY
MKREDQQDATIRCLLLTSVSACFGHHYAHLQDNKGPVTAFGLLFWFCWMWLVAVVLTSCKTAPLNRYKPHPAEPEQHTKCSNRAFVLLKMGIMMPETC